MVFRYLGIGCCRFVLACFEVCTLVTNLEPTPTMLVMLFQVIHDNLIVIGVGRRFIRVLFSNAPCLSTHASSILFRKLTQRGAQ